MPILYGIKKLLAFYYGGWTSITPVWHAYMPHTAEFTSTFLRTAGATTMAMATNLRWMIHRDHGRRLFGGLEAEHVQEVTCTNPIPYTWRNDTQIA